MNLFSAINVYQPRVFTVCRIRINFWVCVVAAHLRPSVWQKEKQLCVFASVCSHIIRSIQIAQHERQKDSH